VSAPVGRRGRRTVSEKRILKILAKEGVSSDQVTFAQFARALQDYRQLHPDAVFQPRLRAILNYTDFALRNRALLIEQWNQAKLLMAVSPDQWHQLGVRFQELSVREAEDLRSGEISARLHLYADHLNCCWNSRGNDNLSLGFDVLAAEAGQLLGTAPGIPEAIRHTNAQSWADFWKYCLWFHLGQPADISEPSKDSVKLCLHLALDCSFQGTNTPQQSSSKKTSKGAPTDPNDIAAENSEYMRDPLIELSEPAKARIKAREGEAAAQLSLVIQACAGDITKARRDFGGYFDLHHDHLLGAVEQARAYVDKAKLLCAQYVFMAHANEYRNTLHDLPRLESLFVQLRESVIKQYGECTRVAIQSKEA
jgi:hypothetical protein